MMEVEWDAAHHVAGSHAAHGTQCFPGFPGNFSLYSCFCCSVVSGSHALHGNCSSTALQSGKALVVKVEAEWDAAHRVAGPHAAHGTQGCLLLVRWWILKRDFSNYFKKFLCFWF
jgi:hypothetical protein